MREEDDEEKMRTSRKGSKISKISLISYTDNANPTRAVLMKGFMNCILVYKD